MPGPLPLLRLTLAAAFVLFVPGYTLQAALFPRQSDLDGAERLGLSFGLSLVVIPPVALLLDRLPWGIRLWPFFTSLGLITLVFAAAAWYRTRRLPPEDQSVITVGTAARRWWASQDRTGRLLYAFLVVALLVVAGAAVAAVILPKPDATFTEFYIVGSGRLGEDYPRAAVVGQPITVTVGIDNREGVSSEYRVKAMDDGRTVGETGPVRLEAGASDRRPVNFAPTETGDDVKVEFFLYRDGKPDPYRTLRLWLKVTDKSLATGSGQGENG